MDKTLGVYIHIPFCASKCGYCDFYSLADHEALMPKYQQALLRHIREAAPQLSGFFVDTLYFGGGTPSFYGAKRLCELFDALKRSARVLKDSEVTVEANPDTVTARDLELLRREGVNRLSIGMQSANDDILRLIGRRHSLKQTEKAVQTARAAGFKNLSLDLIYGLPTQTKGDWADTLNRALALRPEHISCYGLKLEEGTPIQRYSDSAVLPTDDEQADMYLYAVETLERYEYRQYEISNFAQKGFESAHNLKYWQLEDYMGFGPGAHSSVGGLRYSFVRDLEGYISRVFGDKSIIDEYEEISRLGRAAEYIMLGLRTTRGISRDEYYAYYQSSFDDMETLLKDFEQRGWAKSSAGRWSLTSSGFLLSNALIGALLEAQAEQKLSGNPWMREGFEDSISAPTGDDLFF